MPKCSWSMTLPTAKVQRIIKKIALIWARNAMAHPWTEIAEAAVHKVAIPHHATLTQEEQQCIYNHLMLGKGQNVGNHSRKNSYRNMAKRFVNVGKGGSQDEREEELICFVEAETVRQIDKSKIGF